MALIVITVRDTEDGADVSVLAEPSLPEAKGGALTPAQGAALQMLQSLAATVKQDRGLIQLIN